MPGWEFTERVLTLENPTFYPTFLRLSRLRLRARTISRPFPLRQCRRDVFVNRGTGSMPRRGFRAEYSTRWMHSLEESRRNTDLSYRGIGSSGGVQGPGSGDATSTRASIFLSDAFDLASTFPVTLPRKGIQLLQSRLFVEFCWIYTRLTPIRFAAIHLHE